MAHALELTDQNFEPTLRDSSQPVLVDFWAEWCGPCKQLGPTIDALAQKYEGRATVAKLNVDNAPQTARQLGVRGLPTVMLFHQGEIKTRLMGANPKSRYAAAIDALLAAEAAGDGATEAPGQTVARHADASMTQAMMTADLDAVAALLDKQPGLVNERMDNGLRPLNAALRFAMRPLVDALLEYQPEVDAFAAAGLGRMDLLRPALENNPELARAQEADGFTALHLAAIGGHLEAARLLLAKGADPNRVNDDRIRITPTAAAVTEDSLNVLQALRNAGGDLRTRSASGESLLHMAVRVGAARCARYLLDEGLDPAAQDGQGRTPLDVARQTKRGELAALLETA